MSKIKDLTGMTFGRLSVVSYAGSINGRSLWNCKCDCGNSRVVKGKYLLNGDTKSCGCLMLETTARNGHNNKKANRYEIDGEVIKVYFNNADAFFICDKCDENLVRSATWFLSEHGYARTKLGSKKCTLFHNLIVPNSDGTYCDHINGNRLDNRRANLREVTRSQNAMNRSMHSNNASGYKGVSYHWATMKWQAYICHNGKEMYLGLFDNIEDAVAVRKAKEVELFGEYRRAI